MDNQEDLFNRCFDHLLKNEGGYVDDPDDSGGETYKGVSRNNWPNWGGWQIIDKSKNDKSKNDPKFPENLKCNCDLDTMIRTFYKTQFWDKMNLDLIVNENTILQLFDMGINAGISRAVKIAQKICGTKEDGILGVKTAFEINHHGFNFTNMYINARIAFYKNLAEKKPKNKKFLKGWIKRAQTTRFTP